MTDQQPANTETATQRRPLRRRGDGRVIAGVAAGVADHLNIDVVIVRILFVVTTIFTNGLGLIAYVLGWILIPTDDAPAASPAAKDQGERPANGWSRDPLFWVGVGLLIVGAVWVLSMPQSFGPFRWFPTLFDTGWILPLVLIAFGIALWRAGERRGTDRDPAAASAVETHPDAAPRSYPDPAAPYRADPARTSETTMTATSQDLPPTTDTPSAGGPGGPGQPPPPGGPAGQPAWTPPPLPHRERSALGRITIGVALMTAGVLWIVQLAMGIHFGLGRIAAAALLVIGLGLLVGSVAGRARWLIIVGLVLAPVVLVAELLRPVGLAGLPRQFTHGPVGEIRSAPVDADQVRSNYGLGAGSLRLDLSGVVFEEDTTINLQVGAGEVRLTVPEDVDVVVDARIGIAGEVRAFGQRSSGMAVERVVTDEGPADVTLTINVVVGAGEIRVDRPVDFAPDSGARTEFPEWTDEGSDDWSDEPRPGDDAAAELSSAGIPLALAA